MANADLVDTPISDTTSPIVLTCLQKVEAKGNYETAKRLRAIIGVVFRLAITTGAAENDPTYALRGALITPTVTHRAAITDPTELEGLLRAINGFHGQTTTEIALQFPSIVAQRPNEVRFAKWEDFDFTQRAWSIPAEQMKMRRPHKVPLPNQAIALLDDLRLMTGNGVYLFPSLRTHLRPMSENTLNGAATTLRWIEGSIGKSACD